jgi:hypothetical protein
MLRREREREVPRDYPDVTKDMLMPGLDSTPQQRPSRQEVLQQQPRIIFGGELGSRLRERDCRAPAVGSALIR